MRQPSSRMRDIHPFHVMELLARARELESLGRDIVHMEIGEPDFPTPPLIVQAGQRALERGETYYTPALGLPELRQAVSGYYASHFGVGVEPERIVITSGASGALLLALGVLIDPGDGVLMADPGYPCNRNFVRFVDGQAQSVAVGPSSGYQLNAQLVREQWSECTVAALLASPSNPTGTLVAPGQMAAIHKEVSVRGGALIVDEIYQGLVYDVASTTALAISGDIFVVNSFSKFFQMTGWRLGWLVVPEAFSREVEKLVQNLFLAAPTVAQHAALAAFDPDTLELLERRRVEFQRRRDYLVPALRELGFDLPLIPQGAFYIYANAGRFTDDSYQFALDLLDHAGIAVTPGLDFGENSPEQHIRFAYATSIERLEQGVARLDSFLRFGG